MPPEIEIILGTYEEVLLGFKLIESPTDGLTNPVKFQLKQTFADNSHAGSITSVAVQWPWVATGGTDDRIFVYDMRTRKQSQIILSHAGTVNTLEFSPDLSHLLSGSDDGHMIATRVGSWTKEGVWKKAHAGRAVTHISCHPSSKLALSLGCDQVLNTWNLVKGRVAYKTNLKNKAPLGFHPGCLSWSKQGDHFTLSGPLTMEIWGIEGANVIRRIDMPAKPICVTWLDGNECLIGLDNGSIVWISLKDKDDTPPTFIPVHNERVKAIAYLNELLATVSSAGEIKVWKIDMETRKLEEIASTIVDFRPTAMGLLDLCQFGNDQPVEQGIKVEKKPMANVETGQRAKPAAPRGFVTIEYEQDKELDAEKNGKEKQNKIQAKKAPQKAEESSEENISSEDKESDDFSDSDSDVSNDHGDWERKPMKRKQQPTPASKGKAKQQKKK
ncbi:p21-activated protein kinase-interacting protein 1-like [Drosophila sechellia]|uniref:GM10041 n=1 Tax=Drosophila sechellia TaxID=7238 RepID=B4ILG4_DROSE|nr:p21-activated protein kinase-interacting protein 1-like [Drosophila sechellia]EDW53827.1 GM10041 [Drosophila sechellia]